MASKDLAGSAGIDSPHFLQFCLLSDRQGTKITLSKNVKPSVQVRHSRKMETFLTHPSLRHLAGCNVTRHGEEEEEEEEDISLWLAVGQARIKRLFKEVYMCMVLVKDTYEVWSLIPHGSCDLQHCKEENPRRNPRQTSWSSEKVFEPKPTQ